MQNILSILLDESKETRSYWKKNLGYVYKKKSLNPDQNKLARIWIQNAASGQYPRKLKKQGGIKKRANLWTAIPCFSYFKHV